MNKKVLVLITYVISTAVSLTVFSPRVVHADGGVTAAVLVAFAIQKAEDAGLFQCALRLGSSQCRRLDRCTDAVALLKAAKNGGDVNKNNLENWIHSSNLATNCAKALQGGDFSALMANLEAIRTPPPIPTGCTKNKIFTTVNGKSCAFEWAGGKGNPVGPQERLAKFDCNPSSVGDPMCISKFGSASIISTIVNNERCTLEFSNAMGNVTGVNPDESVAKFDCNPNTSGDIVLISDNRISTIIKGKQCFLEWSAAFGGPQVGADEKAAKWDCGSQGEPMSIR